CQQNKTPRRRSNQGPAEQGASSSAWERPCRASLPCAARAVSESVNFMRELTTNRLWDIGPKISPSQYARMILGTAAIPPPGAPATPDDCVVAGLRPAGTGQSPVTTQPETTTRRTQARTLTQL